MVGENEIIILLLGVGVLIFSLSNPLRIRRLPEWKILRASFRVLLLGWVLAVLKRFVWESVFHLLEHVSYAASMVLLALWCWKVFPKEGRPT
jgi:hypothetical protein